MITKRSYTRLTLALDIIRRIDAGHLLGYHELGIIKQKIDLYDNIYVDSSDKMQIICNNRYVPVDNRNICWQVASILKKKYHIDKSVKITIEKNIPVQGGLAGGSSNAATVLEILNSHWQLYLKKDELITIARDVGMDVSFYFSGNCAFDTEATGVLEQIETSCTFSFILVLPPFGVSTKDAYRSIDYSKIAKDTDATTRLRESLCVNDSVGAIKEMHNDFEYSVFYKYPKLIAIRDSLLCAGCQTAFLSGSGSTIIGVAKNYPDACKIANNIPYKTVVHNSICN